MSPTAQFITGLVMVVHALIVLWLAFRPRK
jgi:hypothetical protein